MEWAYSQPVKIIFGSNKVQSLHSILSKLNFNNGLLVCDPIFIQNGLADKVLEYSKGLLIKIFSDITPNPTVENVDSCADIIRKHKIEFIAALGGGSSLDCAKAAASVSITKDSIVEYHNQKKQFTNKHLPLIALPTTSGTGSEVTPVAVLSNPSIGKKAPLVCNNFYPDYAIIDPAITLTVPKEITASTGFDVLAHALEAFWSIHHQPICDALALHASKLVFKYLLKAYEDGSNLEAREKMSEGSLIAGLAFGLPKTTGPHACSFPLTSIYHIPHGEACAFTLDAFTRINAEAEGGRLHSFAKELSFKDPYEMADKIGEMKRMMKLKSTLKEANIKGKDIKSLAEMSMHPNMLNNPVNMSVENLINMYKELK